MHQDTAQPGLTQHPLSAAFPGMAPLDFVELLNDIRENGVQQPITIFEDMVLDGWHRFRACSQLGIECPSQPFTGTSPVKFVLSLNLNRRHLTQSQKASAVVACNAWAPMGSNQHGGSAPGADPATVKEMAEDAGVSERTIHQAKKAHTAGLGEAVKAGKVSVKKAAEIADLPEDEREAAIEAPAPKKAKPEVKTSDVGALTQKVDELQEELREAYTFSAALDEADNILTANDQVAQAWAEVKKLKAENRVLRERVAGLMSEKNEMTKEAKRWMRKFTTLERKLDGDQTFQRGA